VQEKERELVVRDRKKDTVENDVTMRQRAGDDES
jgi:hypothetical protein